MCPSQDIPNIALATRQYIPILFMFIPILNAKGYTNEASARIVSVPWLSNLS